MTQVVLLQTNTAFSFEFNANRVTYRIEIVFNQFSDSYFFNLYKVRGNELLLAGITLSTGTNLLSQFPQWFKMYVAPNKPELYGVNPNSKNIRNFQIWIEDET